MARLTSLQVIYILKRYPVEKAEVIANDYNVTVMTVYKTAQRYGVKKSSEFMNSSASGRIQKGDCLSPGTQFKKGDTSATKGKRMAAMIKNEAKMRKWLDGLWRKGNKPYNTAKDGEIRWRKGVGYYFIRISENNWEFYHRYLWEQTNGKVPEGYNVIFRDGIRRNCTIENLECISNAELALRNSIHRYPAELEKAIRLNSKLQKMINNETN